MIASTGSHGLDPVFSLIEQAAAERDVVGANLSQEIAWLHESGALIDALPHSLSGARTWSDDPLAICGLLNALGHASLPVGRLFEGHINAAQLISLYGSPTVRSRCLASVSRGDLLGVWGADGPEPVQAEAKIDSIRLKGSKVFCSGLGTGQNCAYFRASGRADTPVCCRCERFRESGS